MEIISVLIKSHVHVKDNNRVERKLGVLNDLENPWQTNSLTLAYD